MLGILGLPHDFYFLWNPELMWLHILSDSTISLVCYLTLFFLVKIMRGRRDVPFNWVFYGFSAFMVACGTSHAIDVATLWHPLFWMSGMSKALTAGMALMSLSALVRYTPEILAMPSHSELQKAVWELDSLLECTTTCVLAMGPDWRIDYMNRRARSVLSVQGDVREMTLWDVFPPGTEESRRLLVQVMETRQPTSYEEYSEALGLWTTVQAHPWDNGGITLFFNDETEQRRLQSELRLHGLRDQRIEILARLSGELAHEIKNPLAIIHARASDLAERTAEGGMLPAREVARTCDSIVKTSDRAMRILRGLAALAREGSHDPMQSADIADIVDQTLDLIAPRCKTHGIALTKVVPEGLPPIVCREVQVGQVLMNLLNNAMDAINLSPESERWVRLEVSLQRGLAGQQLMAIDVLDGGPGVAEEAKEHIMQSFYTTKPVGGGIGIGLSVSRSIALDHKGSLELRERDGHTCFRLTLPLNAEEKRTEEEVAA
jgi:signal transduction histidine kinase